MNDYVNWSRELIEDLTLGDSVNQQSKEQQRAEIARLTEEFLAGGGEITYLPYDDTAEREARVGYWRPVGGQLFDDSGDDEPAEETEPFVPPYS